MRRIWAVAVAVAVLASGCGSSSSSSTKLGPGAAQLVYQAMPTPQTPALTPAAMSQAANLIRRRIRLLNQVGNVAANGDRIVVELAAGADTRGAETLVGTTARLEFYDWEANALTPSGKPVASRLQTQDPNAIQISQGSGSLAPGSAGAGSMPLYRSVKLASQQQKRVSKTNARLGAEYFMFGAPGSAACTRAAKDQGTVPVVGAHCYLSGPDAALQDLYSGLPTGVTASEGQTLAVQQGWVVLQAVPPSFGKTVAWGRPNAQFYVLRDNVALFGNDITNPQQSTDQSGSPDLTSGFTGEGANEFQSVTSEIAHRGDLVSGVGQTLDQHFAVALDAQLITVPFIDFKTNPDGIPGDKGADIQGGFTISSAQDLATQLRLGALPINLKLISESTR